MKNTILSFSLVVGLFSCGGGSEKTEKSGSETPTSGAYAAMAGSDTTDYAISIDDAISFAGIYKEILGTNCPTYTPVEAYTIRTSTLLRAIGIDPKTVSPQYEFVRAYLGQASDQSFKMMICPVEGVDIEKEEFGDDVYFNGPYTKGPNTGLPGDTVFNGEHVLNFLFPCPNSCPPRSRIIGR